MYFYKPPGRYGAVLYQVDHLKGKNLLRELIEVGDETKIEGVEIVLSRSVARFEIHVRNARGEPVHDVSVTLVPSDPARWTRDEDVQLFGTTDVNGKCTIAGAPGEYLCSFCRLGCNRVRWKRVTSRSVLLRSNECR